MDIDAEARSLLITTRVGMLATHGESGPLASAVPFLPLNEWQTLVIHISRLAAHSQNLLQDARVSVLIMEPDQPHKNPLALKRLILHGAASPVEPDRSVRDTLAAQFVTRFPEARVTLALGDFQFWLLSIARAQFIAGFGQAYVAHHAAPRLWEHQGRRDAKR